MAHAVDNHAPRLGTGVDDIPPGAHAERIDPPAGLRIVVRQGIVGRRESLVTWDAVLDPVDQLHGMFVV